MPVETLERLSAALHAAAAASRHRYLVVLAGDPPWCQQAASALLGGAGMSDPLWIGETGPAGVQTCLAAKAHRVLGREVEAAVFDAHVGFDVEAFGAVSGSVRGGGLLLLLAPRPAQWLGRPDRENARIAVYPFEPAEVGGRFLRRLVRVLRDDPDVVWVQQDHPPPAPVDAPSPAPAVSVRTTDAICRTPDQQRAVEALERMAIGHRRRPVVLTSDRGRGKSAALGIAAARLLRKGIGRIRVTAPRLEAALPIFECAAALLPEARHTKGALHLGEAGLVFSPPDALAFERPAADVVFVDEAAAIPTPLLERLLGRYGRIAFATTVHGYEGTGRGFAVRFQAVLDAQAPRWRSVRLDAPIRWEAGDPLERLVFRALLLDAAPPADERVARARPERCTVVRLDRDRLAEDEGLLGALFGLLVLAHYQTSPLDLRHLLDGPNLTVWALFSQGCLVGTAVVAREGGFDRALAEAVYEGWRRPRGHLMAQSLAVHAGFAEAPMQVGDRLVRVAVHPAARGRGLGRRLVRAVVQAAADEGIDYLGSSFGATPGLLRFWERCGFHPVRVGVTREAASGTHSVLVMYPLSSKAEALFAAARQRFAAYLPVQLADPLRDLDPDLSMALLRGGPRSAEAKGLDERDRADLVSFAFARRDYAVCLGAIEKLTLRALADGPFGEGLAPRQRALLVEKVVQRREWGEVARAHGLAGRAAVVDALREALRPLVSRLADLPASGPGNGEVTDD